MSEQHPNDLTASKLSDPLGEFLSRPPPDTPAEVIDLLTLMLGDLGTPLPPRLYFEAVEQSPVAISITDPEANILYVNRAFEVLTGYSRDRIKGENESILSSEATPATLYRQLWRTIRQKRTWSGRLVNRTCDGKEYLASLTISPVLDHNREIAYFLGIHRDVTREHDLETELREQTQRIATVLDAAPILVVLLDESGRILLDNHEYKKLRNDLPGQEPLDVLCHAIREQAGFDPVETIRAGHSFKNAEISIETSHASGPRWFSCSGTPAGQAAPGASSYFKPRNDGEQRLLILANDITLRRREMARAHLEHLRARMAEQQTTHVMRESLSAAIYQLQGPLNVIQAALAMIKRGKGDPNTLAGMLAQISASGRRAEATLKAALPEREREAGTPVNLNELLRQVLDIQTDRLLAAGILVEWLPAAVLPRITGQENQLRCMLKHLIDNAILALSQSRNSYRELRLTTSGGDGTVEIEIQDNGPGIDPDDRLRVFEPLFIGWRSRRGHSGMGLTLAQEIVNAHGGCISIDPDRIEGCKVRVSLSAATADDQ